MRIEIVLNDDKEQAIVNKLKNVPNKSAYIKKLIVDDIEHRQQAIGQSNATIESINKMFKTIMAKLP